MKTNKKVAIASVAVVMAGTMAFAMTACKPKDESTKLLPKLEDGKLSYSKDTTLTFDIGDDSKRNVAYTADIISGEIKLIDGKNYTASSLKPAWQAMSDKLGFKLKSQFKAKTAKYDAYAGDGTLGTVDLFTDTVAFITTAALANPSLFLDLNQYLEYMPNYKAFIEADTATYMSLLSDTNTGAMYYAPYYDGNDDIEKYVLTKTNWVESLLDAESGDTATTWKTQLDAKSLTLSNGYAAESFMGKTGSWTIDTLASDSATANVVKLKVDYGAALAAANDPTQPLGEALTDAGVTVGSLASGNIVDLQNEALKLSTKPTGAQLLKILQTYIDVAYKTDAGAKFYEKRSEVFNGHNAGWDVDLLTALYRCLVTNPSLLSSGVKGDKIGGESATPLKMLYGLCAREAHMQRQSDVYSFAGELYGARGLESRYEFSYIGSNGALQDARGQEATYEAMDKMNKLVQEGLVYTGKSVASGKTSFASTTAGADGTSATNNVEALMIHDYVNTQTGEGYALQEDLGIKAKAEEGYYFTPIITPVSKWNDGAEKYMRFTESWRAVKNSGFAIPYESVKDNPEKLSALLAFIDYLFSPDGQIAMTYGPKADNKKGDNGFWYNEEATAEQVTAGKYFEYEGKKYYSETFYAGKYQPTLTENTLKAYLGTEAVYGIEYKENKATSGNAWKVGCQRSYTNFARYVIGSALAVGNKLQSFEYQATCEMGKDGASVVDAAIQKGVLKHPYLNIAQVKANAGGNLWYLSSPSGLPLTQAEAKYITESCTNLVKTLFSGEKNASTNYLWNIIANGLGNSTEVASVACGKTGAECIEKINGQNFGTYLGYKRNAFDRLKAYFKF